MPWPGDPRINIQKDGPKAKRYQIVQMLEAIDKLKSLKAAGREAEARTAAATKTESGKKRR
jgi:molybdenum-dependent DNA-binding transcriptional regulator ModE